MFRPELVREILRGHKIVTRRPLRPQPSSGNTVKFDWFSDNTDAVAKPWKETPSGRRFRCPYGRPHDMLWIRTAHWHYGPPKTHPENEQAWSEIDECVRWPNGQIAKAVRPDISQTGWRRRPSIHMPRWASPASVEIVRVDVERLHEISVGDIIAEGVAEPFWLVRPPEESTEVLKRFSEGWDRIHGAESEKWASNPFVWVVNFKVMQ